MDRPDKTSIYLEHYKLMRQEILQNSAESIKALKYYRRLLCSIRSVARSSDGSCAPKLITSTHFGELLA